MAELPKNPSSTRPLILNTLCFLGVLVLTATGLKLLGRILWCKCQGWSPWSWDIWSTHNSQHLIDPYFFSHVLHGIIFYGILHVSWKSAPSTWRFNAVILIESVWELLENSPMIINRYRKVTISLDYFGDSIANSIFDIFACSFGFLLALKLKPTQSIALFVLTELGLTWTIRDCLILNIMMLLYPMDVIREWQLAG